SIRRSRTIRTFTVWRSPSSGSISIQLSGVHALYPRPDPAQNLVWDRSNLCSHLAHVDAVRALRSEDDDLVARRHLEPGDVGHQHVHAYRSDNRRAAAADEQGSTALVRQPQ